MFFLSEMLYEDEHFNSRELAALVASKVCMTLFCTLNSVQGVRQDSKSGRPNMFVGVVSYFCGRGRTKTCVLGCCRNFLFLRSYTLIRSVIFRHTVFSKG